VEWSAADLGEPGALESVWRDTTRMVWIETPTNPMLSVVDIAQIAATAHARGALVVVDNTFATPYLQLPLHEGADIVVHSATKYLGGHSDVVGGFVALDDDERTDELRFLQNAVGAVPSPFDCYLVLRGLKTLAVRMDRHCENAARVAEALRAHPAVAEVFYPDSELATKQMRAAGGMVSFLLDAGEDAALRVAGATRIFTLAESLGAVESLIEHPARMTHASAADSPLAVEHGLIRLSVGLEAADDLIDDLRRALDGGV
jgi:cystathionine gamma-synthase